MAESRAHLDAALELLCEHPLRGSDLIGVNLYAWGTGFRANDETLRGSLDAASRIFEQAIPLAREQKSLEAEGWSLGSGSDAAWMQGDAEAALTRAAAGARDRRADREPVLAGGRSGFLGRALVLSEYADGAIPLLEDTLRTARERAQGSRGKRGSWLPWQRRCSRWPSSIGRERSPRRRSPRGSASARRCTSPRRSSSACSARWAPRRYALARELG